VDDDDDDDSVIEYSSCEMFALNYSVYNRTQFESWNRSEMISDRTQIVECSDWMYDRSQFNATIVSKVSQRTTHFAIRPNSSTR